MFFFPHSLACLLYCKIILNLAVLAIARRRETLSLPVILPSTVTPEMFFTLDEQVERDLMIKHDSAFPLPANSQLQVEAAAVLVRERERKKNSLLYP